MDPKTEALASTEEPKFELFALKKSLPAALLYDYNVQIEAMTAALQHVHTFNQSVEGNLAHRSVEALKELHTSLSELHCTVSDLLMNQSRAEAIMEAAKFLKQKTLREEHEIKLKCMINHFQQPIETKAKPQYPIAEKSSYYKPDE